MKAKHEELTSGERRYLEHARRAENQSLPLSEYCRSMGLSPHTLYSMRRQMRRKGVLAPVVRAGAALPVVRGEAAERFVAIRVSERSGRAGGPVCWLRHPSGWVIECASWPPGAWMRECFGGEIHAAA